MFDIFFFFTFSVLPIRICIFFLWQKKTFAQITDRPLTINYDFAHFSIFHTSPRSINSQIITGAGESNASRIHTHTIKVHGE